MSKRNASPTPTAPTDATTSNPAPQAATIQQRIAVIKAGGAATALNVELRTPDDEQTPDISDLLCRVISKGGIIVGGEVFPKGSVIKITREHAPGLDRLVGSALELCLSGEVDAGAIRTPPPPPPDPNASQKRQFLEQRFLAELIKDKVDEHLAAEAAVAAERQRVISEAALKSLARKRIAQARDAADRAHDLRREAERLDEESQKLAARFAGVDLTTPEAEPPAPPPPIDYTPLGNIHGLSLS